MPKITELIRERYEGRSILLLGFGREGQSSYTVLRRIFPEKRLAIADLNDRIRENPLVQHDENLHFITGENYMDEMYRYDVIFRSPGIPVWQLMEQEPVSGEAIGPGEKTRRIRRDQVTSQTELFLECYHSQVIGVTGTKGKSTTSSLLYHIFKTAGKEVLLVGNIGNPVFHFIDLVDENTQIVFEMSSHQLEFLTAGPHIAIFLNLFQEHLDAYRDYHAYQQAKVNITRFQKAVDFIVFNSDDPLVSALVKPFLGQRIGHPFSLLSQPVPGSYIEQGLIRFASGGENIEVWKVHQDRFLRGEHNLKNILAAVSAAMLCGIDAEAIAEGIGTFKGLEHRLEYVGEYGRIHFYNDSIATIPEACIEAVRAIPGVDTLIAGGFDRGIDYEGLATFLCNSDIRTLILVGAAGRRIMEYMSVIGHTGKKMFYINRFDDFRDIAFRETRPGHACLLSPAAASYDEFRNFEERGKRFRELVRSGGVL